MAANPQHQNFISGYADAINRLLDARAALKAYRERDAASGIAASLTDEDFGGSNSHLDQVAIVAAFATMDALESSLTDFTKTPPSPTPALATLLRFRP